MSREKGAVAGKQHVMIFTSALHQPAFANKTVDIDDGINDGKDPFAGCVSERVNEPWLRRAFPARAVIHFCCLEVQQSGNGHYGIA
jgi:hypothetical protein